MILSLKEYHINIIFANDNTNQIIVFLITDNGLLSFHFYIGLR